MRIFCTSLDGICGKKTMVLVILHLLLILTGADRTLARVDASILLVARKCVTACSGQSSTNCFWPGTASYPCEHHGRQCGIQDHPYHVRLVQQLLDDPLEGTETFERFQHCSGTLIHEQWVLTSAACYDHIVGYPLKVQFRLRPSRSFNVARLIPDGNIRQFNISGTDGIMLMKLPSPVNKVSPTQLPPIPCTRPKNGEILHAPSYQRRRYESASDLKNLFCVARRVTTPCDKREKCPMYFCAEAVTSTSPFFSCPSDFGGPILRKEGSVVYGVKASGFKFIDICAAHVRQWIADTINDLN